jgi:hypothetical protein
LLEAEHETLQRSSVSSDKHVDDKEAEQVPIEYSWEIEIEIDRREREREREYNNAVITFRCLYIELILQEKACRGY